MYPYRRKLTRYWLGAAVLAVAAGLVVGCQTAAPPPSDISLEGKSKPQMLYLAAVETFEERGMEIAVASQKFLVVTSEFESISERLRRRFTARIIRLPGGATGLRVRAEHQRRHGTGEDVVWKKVESEVLNERAGKIELEIGRAVEKRFRRWKEYRRSQKEDEE